MASLLWDSCPTMLARLGGPGVLLVPGAVSEGQQER